MGHRRPKMTRKTRLFGLCVLLAGILGLYVGVSRYGTSRRASDSGWTDIGLISPRDTGLASDALKSAGIDSCYEGSVVYSISVHPADRRKAVEMLKEDSLRHDYYIQLPDYTHVEGSVAPRR